MTAELTVGELRDMMMSVAARIIDSEPELSRADRRIGDGDHGLGMKRGFSAVRAALADDDMDDVHAVLKLIGDTLLRNMGGASGVIFGLLFRAGTADCAPADRIDVDGLAGHFARALAEITTRGGASPGDKTMVDALEPAVRALSDSAAAGHDVRTALCHAAQAAGEGAEATSNYIARFGKAVSLKERALGFPDPGALSTALIFATMSNWGAHHRTEDGASI